MANVSDPTKKYKSLITSLKKSLECPICLETVKTPFRLCVSGHGVCLACLVELKKCPLCQGLFTLQNPVCVKSILEVLPHLCRHSDNGCDEVVEPGNDHEMFCGYRWFACPDEGCSVKVPITKLMDHYKKEHDTAYICKEETTLTGTYNVYPKIKKNCCMPVFLFDNWFWVFKINDVTEKQFKIFFQATPIGKLEHNYYARVTLERDNFTYTYTLKAAELSECISEVEDEKYCMKIPQGELHRFIDEDGLNCEYFFFRE